MCLHIFPSLQSCNNTWLLCCFFFLIFFFYQMRVYTPMGAFRLNTWIKQWLHQCYVYHDGERVACSACFAVFNFLLLYTTVLRLPEFITNNPNQVVVGFNTTAHTNTKTIWLPHSLHNRIFFSVNSLLFIVCYIRLMNALLWTWILLKTERKDDYTVSCSSCCAVVGV